MKELLTGLIALLIWSFFSVWLYVDVLKPAAKKQVAETVVPDQHQQEADSLLKFYASMPKDLLFFFEFDKAKLITDEKTDLLITQFGKWLEEHPGYMLKVTGHTDFIGADEYNMALGLERADIVADYIASKGIPADRLEISSMGSEQPVANNILSAGRAKNRRTEIEIKK